MIQFKRGSTEIKNNKRIEGSWTGVILGDGQPGYDKATNRLKVGNGESTWSVLKSIGLSEEQILDSEKVAADRFGADSEDFTVFTYGTEDPNSNMVGQVYLQKHNGPAEDDYVIDSGIDNLWRYRFWKSGYAECWALRTIDSIYFNAAADNAGFKLSSGIATMAYPTQFEFTEIPSETITAAPIENSPNNPIFVLTSKGNSKTKTSYVYLGRIALTDGNKTENIKVQLSYRVSGKAKLV